MLLTAIFIADYAQAQKKSDTGKNLAAFDRRKYHFGMHLGYNNSSFYLKRNFDPEFNDSLVNVTSFKQPGFIIYTLASYHFNKNVSVRLGPGISPRVRILNYEFISDDGTPKLIDKEIRSFYVDFPLDVKYRSDRINNFAVYIAAGGQYSLDVASQKNVDNAAIENSFVKIANGNYLANIGGGFDFFLPYFKFGVELRYSYGLKNLLIEDGTPFSNTIDRLSSRNFTLAFTFEG
jgi:hypothetical protein